MRLATGVALVAFAILAIFAVAVGTLTVHRLRVELQRPGRDAGRRTSPATLGTSSASAIAALDPPASTASSASTAARRAIISLDGEVVYPTRRRPLGPLVPGLHQSGAVHGRHASRHRSASTAPSRTTSSSGFRSRRSQREIGNLELLLALGVLAGTVLAFAAGSLVARRAITPIAELTAAAAEIERTRDPNRTLPEPTADDEVAELSRTLRGMLDSLSAARDETESTLERQRAFVADASHELRTPLTSVLANLELLVESLAGSRPRGRRVGAALDAADAPPRRRPAAARPHRRRPRAARATPLDLADVVTETAGELEPAARDHVLELDVQPAPTLGSRDDLQRVATNLIENALRHTPPGTRVTASTRTLSDGSAELVVADDGPGIAPAMRDTLFERFVRGTGDRGGSFGLGLAIVAAVVHAHGGTVTADASPHGGARFTVHLSPTAQTPAPAPQPAIA